MSRIGFVVHGGRPAAVRAARQLIEWLREEGVETRAFQDPALGADESADAGAFAGGLDLVVSVGGDGTFLRGAHQAVVAGCPVLGVNVGRLGFLTAVAPDGAKALIREASEGRAVIEERIAVVAQPESGTEWTEPRWGLNEVMVEKAARHHVLRVAVFIDDEYVTTFSGDGVIVATPTGSTAYSFAAGGPIVSPSVESLVVTPVAAHMVFDRSFVTGRSECVTIEVRGDEPGVLSADGQDSLSLPVGARMAIRAADQPVRLVRPRDREGFYRRVRERFSLPDGSALDIDPGDVGAAE